MDTTQAHINWYYVLRFILTEDVKKYRAVTNFIVEMKSLNGNLAIFHMQNRSKKMYMANAMAMAIAIAHSMCIENSATVLHGSVLTNDTAWVYRRVCVCVCLNVLCAV